VFALSGWDLCGSLTLEPTVVAELIADGDTRWIHRGAYDLMGYRPEGRESLSSLPHGRCLYGPLPAQLGDPTSFASQLCRILAIRRRYGIATGTQLDVAQTSSDSLLAMIHELDGGVVQIALLNFSASPVTGDVTSRFLLPDAVVVDMGTGSAIGRVGTDHTIHVALSPHQGLSLLLEPRS
jgi:hypothetical protein